jgi:hypothetical protein
MGEAAGDVGQTEGVVIKKRAAGLKSTWRLGDFLTVGESSGRSPILRSEAARDFRGLLRGRPSRR